MPIAHPRPVTRPRSPRNALWCRAGVRALVADPTAGVEVVVGDVSVGADGVDLVGGRVLVRPEPGWRWPNDEPDAVGEVVISTGSLGLAAVGWWRPVIADGVAVLVMDVAGLTLWTSTHRICTEEHARIQAVLAD